MGTSAIEQAELRSSEGEHVVSRVWRDHRWLVAIYGVHLMSGVLLARTGILPVTASPLVDVRFTLRYLLFCVGSLAVILGYNALRGSVDQVSRSAYLSARSVIGALFAAALIAQEALLHAAWKRTIGRVTPFRWDETFANLDHVIHFGREPWQILQPIVGQAPIVAALDTAYWMWFPVVLAVGSVVLWLPDRRLRLQALLAWVMVWVGLGTVCAQLFSSAGPAFYAHVVEHGEQGRYAALLSALANVDVAYDLVALDWHTLLWSNFAREDDVAWLAISAMPSMHVAMPVLFSCVLRRVTPIAGALMAGYAVIIFCGSVYLGWHYAIDGYVAALGTWCCWHLAGRLIDRYGAGELRNHGEAA